MLATRSADPGGRFEAAYPYTDNGFAASLDGHLTPEWRLCGATVMEPDVTTMSFKNADGSPRVVSLGGAGSSDRWILRRIDPDDPASSYWVPIP